MAKMQIALNLPQFLQWDDMIARTLQAEKYGFHSVWTCDHMWPPSERGGNQLEVLTTMAAIAARTERLRIGTLVICNSFRNPALLAKALSTIDNISHGRVEIGLGAGWMKGEFRAYGYEFPTPGIRLKQFEESLQILKLMFTEPQASFKGRYFTIDNAPNDPKPTQKPHPPITIGGGGEKVLLRLVAKYADRWNYSIPESGLVDHKLKVLKEHCAAVGRDFNTIQTSEQIMVCLGRNKADADKRWDSPGHPMIEGMKPTAIKGDPDAVTEQLQDRARRGVNMVMLCFGDLDRPETIELFGREVMPRLQ